MSTINPNRATTRTAGPGARPGSAYSGGAYGDEPHLNPRLEAAQVVAGLLFLAGIWVAIAPWVVDYTGTGDQAYWNDLGTGILIAAVAAAKFAMPRLSALSWFNIALGMWLIIAPWVLGYNVGNDSAAQWNDIACGIFVVSLGLIGAALSDGPATARGPRGPGRSRSMTRAAKSRVQERHAIHPG